MTTRKQAVAFELVKTHFRIEPFLQEVWLILGDNEESPMEPIKLLEVNVATVSTGIIKPFAFTPSQDVPYPTFIAEVTPRISQRPRRTRGGYPRAGACERRSASRGSTPVREGAQSSSTLERPLDPYNVVKSAMMAPSDDEERP